MEEEILQLLRENNALLKEILRYIKSEEYTLDQWCTNVAADLFVENLLNNKKR